MQNYKYPGENITLPAPSDVVSGQPCLIGAIFGVAQADAAQDAPVVFVRRGVFELPKTAAQAWTVGAKLYWDNTAKAVTTTATSNTLIGAAEEAAAASATIGSVLLDGVIR